ncbi:MAG TPA: alpha-ketoacid dehydrogenase subunit beta [Micromonospora sp.]
MPVMTMVEAIRDALFLEMERDERVMVIGQDVGRLGGVFRATDGLQEKFGEDRVVDMPLAEAVIAGSALGLAVSGMRPVAEIQFLGFGHQAFHQIGPHIARMRYRSQGRFAAPLTIRAPFGGLVRTPEHHCDAIEAQFVQCPGLKIVMPATAYDAKGLLLASIRDDDPVLFCEPLRGYRLIKDEVPAGDYTVELGKARVAREGDDVTIIAWSAMVKTAEQAADLLAEQGVSAHVLDLRCLVPLDVEAIVEAVERTGRVVVAHEAPLTAGFGAEVIATINDEAFYALEAPIRRVTAPDTPYPLAGVEDFYVPNAERIAAAALDVVRTVA